MNGLDQKETEILRLNRTVTEHQEAHSTLEREKQAVHGQLSEHRDRLQNLNGLLQEIQDKVRRLPISSWTYDTPLSTRAWSRSVRTTGTSRRCTNSSASWLAMSPAPTTPTLVTGRASFLSGTPTGRFARRCTRSKE